MKRKLKVKDSAIHGKGLFATTAIPKGTLLGYCQTLKTQGEDNDYTLHTENGRVDVTCRLKYINHSNKPNVAYHDDLSVVALKDIKAGDELTHYYGDEWD